MGRRLASEAEQARQPRGQGLPQDDGHDDGHRDDFLEVWIAGRRAKGILDSYPITKLAAVNMLANGVTTRIHANHTYGSGAYED